jgi:phosphatidylserine/phosphatidylglycerophosphate/cardiolipin synthase-like enzyme
LRIPIAAARRTCASSNSASWRNHGKLLTVDNRRTYILGFNYTAQDLASRSFGIQVGAHRVVKEILRLFESDANRTDYTPRNRDLVISPENARSKLEKFLRGAETSLDIYDPNLSDDRMLTLLQSKAGRGVQIRMLGCLEKKWANAGFDAREFPGRLHVRAIVRDGRRAYVGSQSLRKLELDDRREVGIIIRDPVIVHSIEKTFGRDWKLAGKKKKKAGKSKVA